MYIHMADVHDTVHFSSSLISAFIGDVLWWDINKSIK